jgi:hypothetical protein
MWGIASPSVQAGEGRRVGPLGKAAGGQIAVAAGALPGDTHNDLRSAAGPLSGGVVFSLPITYRN